MTGLTSYGAQAVLGWATGQASMPPASSVAVALFLTVGQDDGTGFIEVSGNAYQRALTTAAVWGPPSGSPKPIQVVNTAPVSFAVASGTWGTITGFGLYDPTGNLLFFDYLGPGPWRPFTAATSGLITSPAHGLTVGGNVVLTAEYGGALPLATTSLAGLLTINSIPTSDTFTVGATITASGDGLMRQVLPLSISLNQAASFNPGALVLQLA